jgi:hypothetical protein
MKYYQSKFDIIHGSDYAKIERAARRVYNIAAHQTKRIPYIRSKYFDSRKVFLPLLWNHLMEKVRSDRKRRLRYIEPSFDLIRNTKIKPECYYRGGDKFYRFYGICKNGERFVVQVKEDIVRGQLHLLSIFPEK